MKKIILILVISLNLFALSPFSLEDIKDVNLKFVDKTKLLSENTKNKIKDQLTKELTKVGIKTKSDNFSNFIVKVEGVSLGNNSIINITMFIVEDVVTLKNKPVEKMAITYYKTDLFDTNKDNLDVDIYESIIDYLLFDFIEQYIEENS